MTPLLLLLTILGASASPTAHTVAISYFDNNTGRPDLDPLSKGIADMLITDLSSVASLQVVERAKLNEVLSELKLSKTKFIDPRTAQKLGKGLAARYVMTGGYALVGEELRIDARVIRVDTGAVTASEKVEGKKDEFFALEKELVDVLVRALELKLGQGEKMKLRANPTQSFAAWASYSAGLDAADRGDNARARELFEAALKSDPGYRAARTASERLQAIFEHADREAEGQADAAFRSLSPKSPGFVQEVEQLLSGLDDKHSEQLSRKLKVLKWLGARSLLPCPAPPAVPWPTGNSTVLVGGIPSGAPAISYCRTAHELLLVAYRLVEDPDAWDDVPRLCERLIHQLPKDAGVMSYCRGLVDSVQDGRKKGREAALAELEEEERDGANLGPGDWRRALLETKSERKAVLRLWAKTAQVAE